MSVSLLEESAEYVWAPALVTRGQRLTQLQGRMTRPLRVNVIHPHVVIGLEAERGTRGGHFHVRGIRQARGRPWRLKLNPMIDQTTWIKEITITDAVSVSSSNIRFGLCALMLPGLGLRLPPSWSSGILSRLKMLGWANGMTGRPFSRNYVFKWEYIKDFLWIL